MIDLVVTVPKDIWLEWIEEGDAAGAPESGEEWGFYLGGSCPRERVERCYVVAWGMLRGYAPVTRVVPTDRGYAICRRGAAIACTIDETIAGFRGARHRWWPRATERLFPDWEYAGVGKVRAECKYCYRAMRATPLALAENPFCAKCLHERMSKAAAERGPVKLVHDGSYARIVPTAGTEPKP